jgi:hypothetical protein
LATDPHQIWKLLLSVSPAERHTAADMAYAAWKRGIDGKNDTFHPDDWEVRRRSDKTKRNGARRAKSDAAEKTARENAERRAEHAEACEKRAMKLAEIEREAREKAQAEADKLREQLADARAKAKPTETVDLLSSLLPAQTLNAMTAEQVSAKIAALWQEKGTRKSKETAQIDLVLGQLTLRLYDIWDEMFGPGSETPRKRGDSNAPTLTAFIQQYAGKSASWCQRCYSALNHVLSEEWPDIEARLGGSVSIENILKAARDPNRPTARRVSKVQKRLDALTTKVRQRAFDEAVDLVETWESAED